ncbi:MAG: HutD family protein [Kofleriaceae bacterium]|nr:HutD family protein [Kofleriaceae bacterium]
MLIPQAAWQPQPWKNGRGITHEIWRHRRATSAAPLDGFDIRLSVAEIEGAQPFSLFAGYQRVLVPLRDTTLVMQVAGQRVPMVTHQVLAFSGDVEASTVGEGTAIDLNIIGRDFHAEIAMTQAQRAADRPVAVFALTQCTLRGTVAGAAVVQTLQPYDTWVVAPGAALVADVPVVWIRF